MSTEADLQYVLKQLEKGPHIPDPKELAFIDSDRKKYIKELQAQGADPDKIWAVYYDSAKESMIEFTPAYQQARASETAAEQERMWEEYAEQLTRPVPGERVDLDDAIDDAVKRLSERYSAEGMDPNLASAQANRAIRFPIHIWRTAQGQPQATVGADPSDPFETKGMSDLEVLVEAFKPQKLPSGQWKKAQQDLGRMGSSIRANLDSVAFERMAREDRDIYKVMLANEFLRLNKRYNQEYVEKKPLMPQMRMSKDDLMRYRTIKAMGFKVVKDQKGYTYVDQPGKVGGAFDVDLIADTIFMLADTQDAQVVKNHLDGLYHPSQKVAFNTLYSKWATLKVRESGKVHNEHLDYAAQDFIAKAKETVRAEAKEKGEKLTDLEVHTRATQAGRQLYQAYESHMFPNIEREKHDPALEEHGGVRIPFTETEIQVSHDTAYTLAHIGMTRNQRGELVETMAMAGLRDLGGIMRLVTDPAMEAISYDVGPDGKPLDTSDWNYQLAMATNEWLGNISGGEGGFGDYAGVAVMTLNPVTFARHQSEDPHRRRMNSGNYLRDVAFSIARGRTLVDDFNELGETTTVYANLGLDWVPTAAGIMTEVGLPITPVPLVRTPVSGMAGLTAKSIRLGSRGMGHASRLVDSSGVTKQYLTAMGSTAARPFEFVQSPKTWGRQQLIYREALSAVRASGKKPAYPTRVTMMDEAGSFVRGTEASRLPNAMANRVASDMSTGYLRGTLRTAEGSKLNVITNLIVDADKLMVAAYKGGAKTWQALEESVLGRQIKDAYVAAKVAGYKDGTPQIRHRILSTVAEDALKEQFAHAIPNNWVLVTANVVVPVKAWNKHGKGVMNKSKELLESTEFARGTLYKNGKEVVDLLSETLGWSKVNATPYWSTIRSKLLNKKSLTLEEANSVNNMAVSGLLKKEMTGSVQLEYAGKAFVKGGRQAVGRGQGAFGVAAEVIKGVKTAALTPFGAKPAKLSTTGHAPVPIQNMIDSINVRLTGLDREFRNYVAAARRKNRDGFIDDLIEEFASEDVVGDLMNILGVFFSGKVGTTWSKMSTGGGLWNTRKLLVDGGFEGRMLTPDLIKEAIDFLRQVEPGLAKEGIKSRGAVGRVKGAVGLKTDQPDLALFAWMMDGYKSKVLKEMTEPLIKEYPELLIKAGGDDVADMQSARAILSTSGVPKELIEPLLRVTYVGIGDAIGISPSQFREIIETILTDLFTEGTLPIESSTRFADIVMARETPAKIMNISRLRETARAVVTKHMQSTLAPGAALNQKYVNRIAEEYLKTYVESVIHASTDVNLAKIIGQLRASGISVPRGVPHDLARALKPELMALNNDLNVLVNMGAITSLEIKTTNELMKASASGKLWDGLERMRKADNSLFEDVCYDLWDFVNWTRRMAVGGLLGGFPRPNGRYLGLNAVTAPFIAMVTTPAYVMTSFKTLLDPRTALRVGARTMEPVSQATLAAARTAFGRTSAGTSFFNWIHASVAKAANDVVMVDAWGRRWTKARLRQSMDQHNIMYTQTSFEFREKVFEDLRRLASTNPNLKKAGWLKQIWRYLNPANKNIWSVLAEQTDLAFRESVYAEALRRGLTETQAAEISRNVLLDYGKLTSVEREVAARGMLFYAFQRQMMVEVVRTIVTDPFAMHAIKAQVQFVKTQHEESGTWMLEPDYARSRVWSWVGPTYDGEVDTVHYGPSLPALESFNTLVNVAGASIDFYNMYEKSTEDKGRYDPGLRKGWEGMDSTYPFDIFIDRITNQFEEKYMATPGVSAILDITDVRGRYGEGTRTLDPRWILFFQNTGTWDMAQDAFNITASTSDPRKGKPTYQDREWQMDSGGYKVFRGFQYLALILGLERNIRDRAATQMKTGDTPPDWRFKYMGEGDPVLYSVSLDTTMAVPSMYMTEMKIINEIAKDLEALK